MQKRIETLEKLVSSACRKIETLQQENLSLKEKMKVVSGKFGILSKDKEKLNKLINWKKRTEDKLKKLKSKLEVLISKHK